MESYTNPTHVHKLNLQVHTTLQLLRVHNHLPPPFHTSGSHWYLHTYIMNMHCTQLYLFFKCVPIHTQPSATLFPLCAHTIWLGFIKNSQFVPLKIHHSSAVTFIKPLPVALQRAARKHSGALIIRQGRDSAADLREVRESERDVERQKVLKVLASFSI